MDRLIVERKLDSLRRCLDRVRERCPADIAILAREPDLQDIVALNLSRAVQLCVDLALHALSSLGQPVPDTMGQAFDQLANSPSPCRLGATTEESRRISQHCRAQLRQHRLGDRPRHCYPAPRRLRGIRPCDRSNVSLSKAQEALNVLVDRIPHPGRADRLP